MHKRNLRAARLTAYSRLLSSRKLFLNKKAQLSHFLLNYKT